MKDFKSLVMPENFTNTFVVGWDKGSKEDELKGWLHSISDDEDSINDQKLAVAAIIVEEIRETVFQRTQFRCSAGIAHNKVLAKLTCGLNKPNKQTVLPHASVSILFKTLSIKKVRNLGGKFGDEVKEKLGVETMGEVATFSESQLISHFGRKNGSWLHLIAKGIETEPVTSRQLPKSVGCGKNFPGKQQLDTKEKVHHWLQQLSTELSERLKKDQQCNKRVARSLTVSMTSKEEKQSTALSRTCALQAYDIQRICTDAMQAIQKINKAPPTSLLWCPAIVALSITANKFEDSSESSSCNIQSYFTTTSKSSAKSCDEEDASAETNHEMTEESTIEQVEKNEPINESIVLDKKKTKGINDYFKEKREEKNNDEMKSFASVKVENCEKPSNSSNHIGKVCENSETSLLSAENAHTKETSASGIFFPKKKGKKPSLQYKLPLETVTVLSASSCFDLEEANSTTSHETSTVLSFDINASSDSVNDFSEFRINDSNSSTATKSLANFFRTVTSKSLSNSKSAVYLSSHSDSDLSPDISFGCEKCAKRIPCWEKEEHADFHFALQIQNEAATMQAATIPSASKRNQATKLKAGTKRLSKSSKFSPSQKKAKQRVNTLDGFLK